MIEAYNGHRIDEAYKHMEQYLKCLGEKGVQVNPEYKWLVVG